MSSAVAQGAYAAAEQILACQEKIVGLDGVAGAGKTTTLAVIREGAEASGYRVEGFAPTSRAAQKLGEAGIQTSTLQLHLAKGQQADTASGGSTYWTKARLLPRSRCDVLLYSRNSKETGLQKGEYAQVKSVDAAANQITVMRADGSEVTYDPRRQQGVLLYGRPGEGFLRG